MHSAERKGQNALCVGPLKAALCVQVCAWPIKKNKIEIETEQAGTK